MNAVPEQLELFAAAEPDFDFFDAEVFEDGFSNTFRWEMEGEQRLHRIEYGWLASEADVAATHVVQLVTNARVDRADPQEPVAAYLRDASPK